MIKEKVGEEKMMRRMKNLGARDKRVDEETAEEEKKSDDGGDSSCSGDSSSSESSSSNEKGEDDEYMDLVESMQDDFGWGLDMIDTMCEDDHRVDDQEGWMYQKHVEDRFDTKSGEIMGPINVAEGERRK